MFCVFRRNAAIAIANQQENDMNSSANRSTIKESIVESISDIRARLIAKSAAAAPSREKLTGSIEARICHISDFSCFMI